MYRNDMMSSNNEVIGLFTSGANDLEAGDKGIGIEEARRLVGMASLGVVVGEASVTSIAVAPEERGKGFGKALLVGLMLLADAHAVAHHVLFLAFCSHQPACISC